MFRSIGTWRSNWRDHTKLQTVFMHTNVSTCDFLRFDANDKGDFEAQKLEKSWFFMIFSTSESSKKFLKCRMISKWVCKMFYKCRAFKWYELQGCTMCQTVFNYRNENPPPLIAQFGTRFFKCSEYMKLRQNRVTCRLWKILEPQICLKCLWNCFQRVQRPQIDLQLTWFGLQNIHFGDTNDFLIFSVFFLPFGST